MNYKEMIKQLKKYRVHKTFGDGFYIFREGEDFYMCNTDEEYNTFVWFKENRIPYIVMKETIQEAIEKGFIKEVTNDL